MVQQETVPVRRPEEVGFASAESLAGIAALYGSAGPVSDGLEVGSDTRAIVVGIGDVVGVAAVCEVGAEDVLLATGIEDGGAGDNGRGGAGAGDDVGGERGGVGGDAGSRSGGYGG